MALLKSSVNNMLTIRQEQMVALQQAMNERFARKIRPSIREEFPDKTTALSDIELERYLVETIKRAQSYGLETDKELTTFIRLTFIINPNFDKHGIFHVILIDKTVADDKRMSMIFEKATDKDWLEAVEMGH